jgi:hypothetical protein
VAGARQADGVGLLRVSGKVTTAGRVAWELERGPLPDGARLRGCPDEPAWVRVSHLALIRRTGPTPGRRPRGSRLLKIWSGRVTGNRWSPTAGCGSSPRRSADTPTGCSVACTPPPMPPTCLRPTGRSLVSSPRSATRRCRPKADRDITVDEAVDQFLRDVDEGTIDRLFGQMRQAGLS